MSLLEKDLAVIIDPPVHKLEVKKKKKSKETFVTKLIIEPYIFKTKKRQVRIYFVCIVQTKAIAEIISQGNETLTPKYLLVTWPKPEDHCCVPSIT